MGAVYHIGDLHHGHGFSNKMSYQLHVLEDKNTIKSSKIDTRHTRTYVYDEVVWCISNRNTNFLCRRDGAVMLTGNCHSQTLHDYRYANVSCENVNYKPVDSQVLRECFKEQVVFRGDML